MDPLISIVIPTRNRRDVLGNLFKSIAAQERSDIETIVVDDASTRAVTAEVLSQAVPISISSSVKVIRKDESVGACAARNAGIAAATGRFILFVDDDVELLGHDLCTRLVKFADDNPKIGVIALAEIAPDGGWGFNLGPDGVPLEVARFHGCGVMFRRECLQQAGGFLEPLGYYYEEFELSMRVLDTGWKIVFHPGMKFIHFRDPRGRDSRQIARLISRNALLTALARFPLWMLPPAIALQLIRFSAKSWFRSPQDLVGPLMALTAALQMLPMVLKQRRPMRSASLRAYRRLAKRPEVWHSSALVTAPSKVLAIAD